MVLLTFLLLIFFLIFVEVLLPYLLVFYTLLIVYKHEAETLLNILQFESDLLLDDEMILQERDDIYTERDRLLKERGSLQERIDLANSLEVDAAKIAHTCEVVRNNLGSLTIEDKRLALEALDIKVLLDGHNVNIQGTVPIDSETFVTHPS